MLLESCDLSLAKVMEYLKKTTVLFYGGLNARVNVICINGKSRWTALFAVQYFSYTNNPCKFSEIPKLT